MVWPGIGLAMALQLLVAMNSRVDVVNCAPGVEVRIYFPTSIRYLPFSADFFKLAGPLNIR